MPPSGESGYRCTRPGNPVPRDGARTGAARRQSEQDDVLGGEQDEDEERAEPHEEDERREEDGRARVERSKGVSTITLPFDPSDKAVSSVVQRRAGAANASRRADGGRGTVSGFDGQ